MPRCLLQGILLALLAALVVSVPPARAAGEDVSAVAREASPPGAARMQFRQGPLLPGSTLARVGGATAGGLLLACLGVLGLRRHYLGVGPRAASGRRIRVLETQRLTARACLLLVRVGDRELLLGQTDERLVLLREETAEGSAGPPVQD